MNRTFILPACLLALAVCTSQASAQAGAAQQGKPPEFHTALAPSQSPPLSPAQLAKAAAIPSVTPASPAPQREGVKAPALSTSRPPVPRLAGEEAAATAGKLARRHDAAPLAGMAATQPKPAPLATLRPADPARAGADAAALAARLARHHGAPATGRPGPKPAAVQTNAPAPAAPDSAVRAKRALLAEPGAGRPR